jgi:hypothetical protein
VIARYDIRWTRTIQEDDQAQAFNSRMQLVTLRGDVTGPTGLEPFGRKLGWRATAGYRGFLEGDLFDVEHVFQIGGALELDMTDVLPVGTRASFGGAWLFGDGLTGWTLGVGVSF